MVKVSSIRVKSNTNELHYIVTMPSDFNPAKESLPMIVFLHGAGEGGTDIELVKVHGIPKHFSADPDYCGTRVVTLSPQCPSDKVWNNITDQLMYMIETVANEYNIDKSRITLTGLSMGGFGTWEMGCAFPGYFAALAPVCGGGMSWRSMALVKTPIWAFHGREDATVPVFQSEDMVRVINSVGGNARLTIYDGVGHDSWNQAYSDKELIWWLASAKK